MSTAPRLLFLATEDWFFASYRGALAQAARVAGFDVHVACRVQAHGDAIRDLGATLHPLAWRRDRNDPLNLASAYGEIRALYRRLAPDLVHHVALKPILIGGIAARRLGAIPRVNEVTGLGYLYTSPGPRARLARLAARPVLRYAFGGSHAIALVQNQDDRATLLRDGLVDLDQIALLPGGGVDTDHFRPIPEPPGPVIVAYTGRMLRDKGLVVLVEAARRLRAQGKHVAIELYGPLDLDNPTAITAGELDAWRAEGLVDWRGSVADVREVWRKASICVMPSFREGMPRALLEAAACARALIACDVPGCRDIIRDGETGLLVPPRDPDALAEAIDRLARDPVLRNRFTAAVRARMQEDYQENEVLARTIGMYHRIASPFIHAWQSRPRLLSYDGHLRRDPRK